MRAGRLRPGAVTAALWLLVVVGAVAGVFGMVRASAAAQARNDALAAVPVVEAPPPSTVLGMAEWAVHRGLPSLDATVAGVTIAEPSPRPRGTDLPVRVLAMAAIGAVEVDDDYWAVTVAAEVQLASDLVVEWFLQVGVVDADPVPVVVTDPALVSAPPAAHGRIEVAGTLRPTDSTDPAVNTVEAFLIALLSGDVSVDRWTAPGVSMTPAAGAGTFDEVSVTRTASEPIGPGEQRIRAEVTATTSSDMTVRLAYEVVVVEREGRWEVTAVAGAPTLTTPVVDEAPTSRVPDPAPTSTTSAGPAASAEIAPTEGTNPNPSPLEEN